MPEPGERHIAQELRGLGYTQEAVPEWKVKPQLEVASLLLIAIACGADTLTTSLGFHAQRAHNLSPTPTLPHLCWTRRSRQWARVFRLDFRLGTRAWRNSAPPYPLRR